MSDTTTHTLFPAPSTAQTVTGGRSPVRYMVSWRSSQPGSIHTSPV